MDYSFENSMMGFVDERLSAAIYYLQTTDTEYMELIQRREALSQKIQEHKNLSTEVKELFEEYWKVDSDITCKQEPAMYKQGFADAMKATKYFSSK